MKTYYIWTEGFNIQGSSGKVSDSFIGISEGNSFEEAVIKWYKKRPDLNFCEDNLTYWGCALYSGKKPSTI